MARNITVVNGTARDVFEILMDAEAYPQWVVGAKKTRAVDDEWPEPGAAFYHSMAGGTVKDKTQVLRIEQPKEILLEAYARPFGIARVLIQVEAQDGRSKVTITEFPTPGSALEKLRPLVDPLIHMRNVISLRRLRGLVESRRIEARNARRKLQPVDG